MRVGIGTPKDFWSGAIFVGVGLAAVVLARAHPMGTAMRMGPAYFPTMLGGLLALIGLITVLRSLVRAGEPIGRLAYGKVSLVLASNVLFALLLRRVGLVVSLILLVLTSAYASQRFSWRASLALAVGLAAACAITFVTLLGLPIPLLGAWLGE